MSIFRTITGPRCKTRRMQFTGIPPTSVTLGVASSTIILSVGTTLDIPVTIMAQEALVTTVVLDTTSNAPATTETKHELSIPETVLPVHPSTNESQLGASYLNNCIHQVAQNANVFVCSLDSYAQENLKSLLKEKLNAKIYSTFKEMFSNTNLDSVHELSPKV